MANLELADLFKLGRETVLKEFYLPINESLAGFDKDWLRNIVQGEEAAEDKLNAIKSHEYLRKGKLIAAHLENLGLQVLVYADNHSNPLIDFQELVFRHGPVGREQTERLNELSPFSVSSLEQTLQMSRDPGYCSDPIRPEDAEISQIGNFRVDSFGPDNVGQGTNRIKATKTFKYDDKKAELSYSASLDSWGNIDTFSISFEIFSGEEEISNLLTRIDVKNQDGRYVPRAEVRVKSKRAQDLGSKRGLVGYTFDQDGHFESIRLYGSQIRFDRGQIEDMEALYGNLIGIVYHNGELCLKLTNRAEGAEITALLTGPKGERHTIQAVNSGQLVAGEDYSLVPVIGLRNAPGLQGDLLSIQWYRQFVDDFSRLEILKGCSAETIGLDYVKAILTLASVQHRSASDVALLN